VAFIEFPLTAFSYDNGLIELDSPGIRIDNYLGLCFRVELNGNVIILPLTYPAIAPAVFATGPEDLIQVFVRGGGVLVIDINQALLGFPQGFVASSGADQMTLAVAILGS
jgi:hypothetical protein